MTTQKRTTKRPAKSSRKSSGVTVPDVSELLEQPATETVTTTRKSRSSRSSKTAASAAVEAPPLPEASELSVSTRKSKRMEPAELKSEFDTVLDKLESELDQTRSNKGRPVSTQTFRGLIRDVKKLRAQSLKCMKKVKPRTYNSLSGIQKPVPVSSELASFAGWDPSEFKSRVDATRFICKYIADNNLQNPENRREILADKKLAELLNYDPEVDKTPLTYFYIQKIIQPHFDPKS